MNQERIHKEKMAALQAAWSAAEGGKDFRVHLKTLNERQLQEIACEKELGVSYARIVANGPGGNVCSECAKLDGRVFSLKNEFQNPHLPNVKCSCKAYEEHQTGFCLCYYEVVFDDEL